MPDRMASDTALIISPACLATTVGAEDTVGPFPDMDLDEAFLFAVHHRTRDIVHQHRVGLDRDAVAARLRRIDATWAISGSV